MSGRNTNLTLTTVPPLTCGSEVCPEDLTECCFSSNPWYGYHRTYCCHAEQKAKLMQTTLIVVSGWVLLILFIIMVKCCKIKLCRRTRNGSCSCSHPTPPTEDKLPTYEEIMRGDREDSNKMQSLPGYENTLAPSSTTASTSAL